MVRNRDSGVRASSPDAVFAGSGFGMSVAIVAVTAPIVTGPGLSPLSGLGSSCPALNCFMSVSPQLRGLLWMIGTAARPFDGRRIGVIELGHGNAVSRPPIRSVIG